MSQSLGGPGINLPYPQFAYPTGLASAPIDLGSNYLTLSPGDQVVVPAGPYLVNPGTYSVIQYKDPVTGIWRVHNSSRGQLTQVNSDGQNVRVANLTGCPVAAVVTNAGTGYVQSTTTVTPSSGTSTWQAIVGGQVSVVGATVANAGVGYGVAPIVIIAAPPSPGVPATAYATIAGGTVTGVTMVNKGAGYLSAPVVSVQPNPTDPNAASITTQAAVVMGIFGTGSISAILCTNPGVAAGSTVPTLTIAGAGTSGAATVLTMTTLTGATVFSAGAGYTGGAVLTTYGGIGGATSVSNNPAIELAGYIPRPASALLAAPAGASIASVSAVYDGGLFVGAPTVVISPISGVLQTTSASIAGIYGSANDTIVIQPSC